jgi:hypothetical protein
MVESCQQHKHHSTTRAAERAASSPLHNRNPLAVEVRCGGSFVVLGLFNKPLPYRESKSVDLLTHALLTRHLIGRHPSVLVAGIAPDIPFYLTYPAWVVGQGEILDAFTTNQWPYPPRWMRALHHAFHSLPLAIVGAVIFRFLSGRWPRHELAAWVLHIIIDIPTHSRQPWGPRFLWPLSRVAVDGISWPEFIISVSRRITKLP